MEIETGALNNTHASIRGVSMSANVDETIAGKEEEFFRQQKKSEDNKAFFEYAHLLRTSMEDEKLRNLHRWSSNDVAQFMGVTPASVRNWAKRGWLEYIRDSQKGWYWFSSNDIYDLQDRAREVEPLLRRYYPRAVAEAMKVLQSTQVE